MSKFERLENIGQIKRIRRTSQRLVFWTRFMLAYTALGVIAVILVLVFVK